jgi:hypothetical protein
LGLAMAVLPPNKGHHHCYRPPPSTSATIIELGPRHRVARGRRHRARHWLPPPRPPPIELLDNGRHHLGRRHRARPSPSSYLAMAATTLTAVIKFGPCLRARQWPCCCHHQGPPPFRSAATMAVFATTTRRHLHRARPPPWPYNHHQHGPPPSSSDSTSTREPQATLPARSPHLPEDLVAQEGTTPSKT